MEKITQNRGDNLLRWRSIVPNEVGTGVCYLHSCVHRMTRDNRPYIACYLRDVDGAVIPGYVWDVADLRDYGIEMSQATHTVVQISYEENYHPTYGMSVHIRKIGIVVSPPIELLSAFVGSVKDAPGLHSKLSQDIAERIGRQVFLPYVMCTLSNPKYLNGMVGGIVVHYTEMLKVLDVYATKFSNEEVKRLWSAYLLFIYAHSNYVLAEAEEGADITLATELTASIEKYIQKLDVTSGVLEIVQMFFGYEPKDIFVRMVKQVSDALVRVDAEVNVFKTLPYTREGRTADGVIKNYPPREKA